MGTETLLLPYQSRWTADTSQVKVVEKSRRIGLTWGQAYDDVLTAATRGRDGMDVLYISFNQDMTREYIDTCADWAKKIEGVAATVHEELFRDSVREIKAFRIDFASGHKILALSNRPSNLRGKQGRVVIDEAAFVDDLDELLKAALALLMWGGQVVVISTHNGVDNSFNTLVQEIRAGRLPYSLHRITLDDALAEGLYRRICAVTKKAWSREAEEAWRADLVKTYGDGADEELFCIPRQSSGAYLPLPMIQACMDKEIPVITWTEPARDFVDWPLPIAETWTRGWIAERLAAILDGLPKDRAHFCGVDFGRSGDLSVFWPATEEKDLRLTPPFVLELRNCPHRTQQQILFAILDALPRFSGVSLDARGNGSALAEACRQEYGTGLVREVMISEGWYRETMPLLKAGLEDKTLILPQDADILSDFRSLQVVKGVARVPDKRGRDKTGGRHGDSVIACAMMLDARKELGSAEPWEYVGVPMQGMDLKGWE